MFPGLLAVPDTVFTMLPVLADACVILYVATYVANSPANKVPSPDPCDEFENDGPKPKVSVLLLPSVRMS